VPPERIGDASSAVTTFRQLGASFAVALFGIVAATSTARLALEGYDRTEVGALSMQEVVLSMLAVSVVCLALSVLIPNRVVPVRGAAGGAE